MDKKKTVKPPSVFRVKREGPTHVIFVGQKHIGTVVEPTIGGTSKRASKYLAISRLLGKKSAHDDKKKAIDWVTTKSGVSTKMAESYDKMTSTEINNYFHQLYEDHKKTGMSPKFFKSPLHLAKIEEKNKHLETGSLTRCIQEGPETEIQGATARTQGYKARKRSNIQIIKKDPSVLTSSNVNGYGKMAENYKKIRQEALQEDKDKDKKDKSGPKPNENEETGDLEVEIKKTETGKPGDIIVLNPKLKQKKPSDKKVDDKPQHKKTPPNP